MAQPVLAKAFLQPAKIVAMYCHPGGDTHPSHPILHFLLVQNLSLQWIAPTDNNWPKLHDEYIRHWWLRGKRKICATTYTHEQRALNFNFKGLYGKQFRKTVGKLIKQLLKLKWANTMSCTTH